MFEARSTSERRARASGRGAAWLLAAACSSATPATSPPSTTPAPTDAGVPTPEPVPAPEPELAAEPAPRPTPKLHLDTSDETTRYYLELPLRMQDLVLAGPLMQREMAYTFVDGGQFEIYVKPAVLPVGSPGCDALIIRMPWTKPELPGAAAAVEVKRKLFAQLEDLTHGRSPEVTVVVELGPHVEVAKDDPKQVSLTRCELFFRYAHETYAYVDHVKPL